MKKLLSFFCVALFCAVAVSQLAAQAENPPAAQAAAPPAGPAAANPDGPRTTTPLYPIDVAIKRIYPYSMGYVVSYKKGAENIDAYIPNEWFDRPADDPKGFAKAEKFLLDRGKEWPHLTAFYENGQFVRLRLYVRKEGNHESWGHIPEGVNLDDKFTSADTLTLQFR